MEDNHFVIKYLHPRSSLIEKVPMKSNHLFPFRIMQDMKEKENTGDAFKQESKEVEKHHNKEEKDITQIQAAFQSKVQGES